MKNYEPLLGALLIITSVYSLICPSYYEQICYGCRGDGVTCCENSGNFGSVSSGVCVNFFDGDVIVSVDYDPVTSGCAQYTCTENILIADDANRWLMRKTTNPDCKKFKLSKKEAALVSNRPYDTANRTIGECFSLCFDLEGCHVMSYNNATNICKIYTTCGTSCDIVTSVDTNDVVYTRQCLEECSILTESEKYYVSMACGRSYGDSAEYKCKPGYTLSGGSLQTTCQYGGVWSNNPPTCTQVGCGPPPSPSLGSVYFTGTNENAVASFSCDTGYYIVGSASTKCLSTNLWSEPAPTCAPVECPVPVDIVNGTVDSSNGTRYQDVVIFTCDEGHYLSGENNMTCQENGTWTSEYPECVFIECGMPPIPEFGMVTFRRTTYLATAKYNCTSGYTLLGINTALCDSNAIWSWAKEIVCVPIDCGYPSIPAYGNLDTTNGTVYLSFALYTCNNGYVLNGSDIRVCQEDGSWNGSVPMCVDVDCGYLQAPMFGYVDLSFGTTYRENASYSCQIGYWLNGTAIRTCTINGSWSEEAPNCVLIECPNITEPDAGILTFSNSTMYLSEAQYDCLYGYALVGHGSRTCQIDGYWSGGEPSCSLIDCGFPSAPTNGNITHITGTFYHDEIAYECYEGYVLIGVSTRYCMYNNTWSGSPPICELIDCGQPSYVHNGKVSALNGTTYGMTASFTCDEGYKISGSETSRCLSTGWYPSPACNIIDCGPLANPINGNVTLDFGTTYGATAVYSCRDGYYLDATVANTRTCTLDGTWSDSAAVCRTHDVAGSTSPRPLPPRIYIMACLCNENKTFIKMTQDEIVAFLIVETEISSNTTSAWQNRHNCMPDSRISSRIMGLIGSSIIASVVAIFVIVDIINLYNMYYSKIRKRKFR